MKIQRIDEAFEIYDEHFPNRIGMDPKLEFMLVQALLVVIYSEFEQKFNDIVVERFSLTQDNSLVNYISSFNRGSVRRLKLHDIAGFAGRFGQSHGDEFKRLMMENNIACDMYSSIVIDRHKAAHGSGSSETITGVRKLYDNGHVVLDLFRDALWVELGS